MLIFLVIVNFLQRHDERQRGHLQVSPSMMLLSHEYAMLKARYILVQKLIKQIGVILRGLEGCAQRPYTCFERLNMPARFNFQFLYSDTGLSLL